MKSFELLEHTADVGVRATGATMKEAFEAAAQGMFSIAADLSNVEARESREVLVEAGDREALLFEWLNELLYLLDAKRLLLKTFDITEIDDTHLRATVAGEPIDGVKHELRDDIKAVTYHMLRVEKADSAWIAQAILDV